MCGPGKHSCQPFCGPEGRFYCSDSVCSLWPAPFSYLCVLLSISVVITRERWRDSTIHEIRHLFCHATTTGHRVRFVDGLPGASLPPEPDALHKSLIFYLLVFCSSDAVAV